MNTDNKKTETEQCTIPSVSSSLTDLITLKDYYEKIMNTCTGGCMNKDQVTAKEKYFNLKNKIDELYENYC